MKLISLTSDFKTQLLIAICKDFIPKFFKFIKYLFVLVTRNWKKNKTNIK